jgi:hypothetical protein
VRYMLFHCVDESTEFSAEHEAQIDAATAAWADQATRDGISVLGGYLRPARDARTVRVRAGEVLFADGPFAETKEQIGGYDVIDCASLEDALAAAARHPVAQIGTVEVRPILHA